MAARGDKPLPDLPLRASSLQDLAALSLDARSHLKRFVLHSIEEEDALQDDREAWVGALEGSLVELGACILKGGWLTGLKRGRKLKAARRCSEARTHTTELAKAAADAEVCPSLKGKEKQQPCELEESSSSPDAAPLRAPEDIYNSKLEQLRNLVSTVSQPQPKPSVKHLLLSVDAFGSAVPAPEDAEYDFVHAHTRCTFTSQRFALPGPDSQHAVLYGVDEWDEQLYPTARQDCVQVVGGTFQLVGTLSAVHHASLCKVLRVSIYVYLSLLLEQHVLLNSHVRLQFPKPPTPTAVAFPSVNTVDIPLDGRNENKREPPSASTLWSFFSRKTGSLLSRAADVAPSMVRRGSLDLPLTHRLHGRTPSRSSDEGTRPRPRRFSFVITRSPSNPPAPSREEPPLVNPFLSAVECIEASRDLLSTSPGIAFPLPRVLSTLAEKERHDASRKLTGDEKIALTSLLGWDGKKALGRSMAGTAGFVRQQGLSVLFSEHVPFPLMVHPQPQASIPAGAPSPSTMIPPSKFVYCGSHRRWVTYRYYEGGDETLGETITRMCSTAEETCDRPGCHYRRGDHDLRWIHGGMQLVATVSLPRAANRAHPEDEDIRMWEACAACGRESNKERMADGTFLISFAKYMELLIYSPALCRLGSPLCEHTTAPPLPWVGPDAPLPNMRMNVRRKFLYQECTVTFALSAVEDIFELRTPRLRFLRTRAIDKTHQDDHTVDQVNQVPQPDDGRRMLRREIKEWWQGLSDHMDLLEENFATGDITPHKALPRLPSTDDDYDTSYMPSTFSPMTPKAYSMEFPYNPPPNSPNDIRTSNEPFGTGPIRVDCTTSSKPSNPASSSSSSVISTDSSKDSQHSADADPISLLSTLRHTFQRTEQALYSELLQTPVSPLNNVRRSFWTAARGASKRLTAWETKHAPQLPKGSTLLGVPKTFEPEWWNVGCHAVPGGSTIVREDDWGSIIAFTLSSLDYQRELASLSTAVLLKVPPMQPPIPADVAMRPSFFKAGSSFRRLIAGNVPQPDPDEEGIVWQEPEAHSAVITRKEHPRDPTTLMALREVLRHRGGTDSSTTPTQSKLDVGMTKINPPEARAKPAVELSKHAADGYLSGLSDSEAMDVTGRILQDLAAHNLSGSWTGSSSESHSHSSSSGFVETNIRRGKASSMMSDDSDSTITAEDGVSHPTTPPPLPPKEKEDSASGSSSAPSDEAASPSITFTLTQTLANAMRFVIKAADGQPQPQGSAHHGLLSTDSPPIDERPHIKYDWTIGKRLKFSCTVYYAKQFDALRRRCGIEDVFVQSLSRSANWAAQGGKSKSNFWKTSDDQFIIKTLVNAWNVADLQVLIELGPSYFRYMDTTANRPTVLAKLLGFYTVEIKNLESGTTQTKADLLVMENLFYNQNVSKTFDLKGMQGRKVKTAASGSNFKTLFDGEWIEGQRRALTLVHPHSKLVVREALKSDCDFLAKSNIMDYSLLLGIDTERKEIACGLVDTIGSYTFAKTLEYKAKQGLNAGKETTVIPPHEYQERFVGAMDDYFLACPDKWSRPLDGTPVPNDYKHLPSVL